MHNFLSRTSASLLQCSITLLHITTRTRKMQEHSHPSTSHQNKRCDKSGTEKGKRMRVQEGALHVRILPSTVSLPDFANQLQCSIALHAIQCKKRTARPLHPRILTLHLFARQTVLQPPARRDGGSCKSKGHAVQIKHPCTSFSLGHPQICCSARQPCTSPRAQGKCKSIPTPLSTSIQNKRCDKSGTDKGKRMRVQEGALHIRIHRSTISLSDFRRPTFKCTEKTARPLHTPAS